MAFFEIDFKSKTLKRSVQFNVILPVEKYKGPYPTLYLLHGLTDNRHGWIHNTRIRMWAEEMGLAVVMPSGDNSFYMDILVKDGCLGDYGEYIGNELVNITREMFPLSNKREDTFIGGLSMGGFGACRNGLKYSDVFSKVAVLSGALHFYEYSREWVETNGNILGEARNFGNIDDTINSDRNPRYLIKQIKEDDSRCFPDFYIACGLQDHLLESNRSIAQALKDAGANVFYEDGEGIHDWIFWDEYIQYVLKWLNINMKEQQR